MRNSTNPGRLPVIQGLRQFLVYQNKQSKKQLNKTFDRWYNDSGLYCDGDICDINIKLKSTSSCDPKLIEEQCPYKFSTHLYEAIVRY